ncbi:MAG: (2Fe-2S)-binding protein [Deltaproteobacteria bacterium]|nr:(2Fe-2S)-binding protein [Deltaproteobacteria bacterium]MBI3078458.1 (2Fe-2S)-binding protein [Deltaproteobacteria bacterium]
MTSSVTASPAAAIRRIRIQVNGQEHECEVRPNRLLVDFLRYDLGLTGTKEGCGVGVCGLCTVLLDGQMVASCLTLAVFADGGEVTTIEGLAVGAELHPVQDCFIEYGGFQCGICTPGQIMAAKALLDDNPTPTEEEIKEWMMGNLCRCTGYYKIVESVQRAAGRLRGAGAGDGATARQGPAGARAGRLAAR